MSPLSPRGRLSGNFKQKRETCPTRPLLKLTWPPPVKGARQEVPVEPVVEEEQVVEDRLGDQTPLTQVDEVVVDEAT